MQLHQSYHCRHASSQPIMALIFACCICLFIGSINHQPTADLSASSTWFNSPILFVSGNFTFTHPGAFNTEEDFIRIRTNIAAGLSPWKEAWVKFQTNSHSSSSWWPNPIMTVCRTGDPTVCNNNYMGLLNDAAAAYATALRWKVSQDTAFANQSILIMNRWAQTMVNVTGNIDYFLLTLPGYQLGAAGELMRDYPGWAPADFKAYQDWMVRIWYPLAYQGGYGSLVPLVVFSNWQLACSACLISVGILADREDIFDQGINIFKYATGNGGVKQTVYWMHPGMFGQTQESGRDQGHDTLSLMLLTNICEMAWNQGIDLYSWDNYRVLAASEYVAKGNIAQFGGTAYQMPFVRYHQINIDHWQFAPGMSLRPEFTMIYNHYANRLGLAAPYTKAAMALTSIEGGGGDYGGNSGGFDQLGFGTLSFSREPYTGDVAPLGLVSRFCGGNITLSWFGGVTATSYSVARSSAPGGPYVTLVTGIRDLRTYTDPIAQTAQGIYYYVVTSRHISGATLTSAEYMVNGMMSGLLLDLEFNEGYSNTTTIDLTGNGWNGLFLAGSVWGNSHSKSWGLALQLNGVTKGVQLPAGVLSGLSDFTIMFWLYWTGGGAGTQHCFWFGSDDVNSQMWLSPKYGSTARFVMALNDMDGGDWMRPSGTLATNWWVHIAVTLNGTIGTLWQNAVALATNTGMRYTPQDLSIGNTTQNFIGSGQKYGSPLTGAIDKFRIYRQAFNQTTLQNFVASEWAQP